MKRITSLLLLLGATLSSHAQQVLTLDSCRALALANNKELRISQEKVNAAHYEKKAAFTNYLPKIDLTGGYMRTQKEISLLSDAQKQSIGNMGTNLGNQLQQGMQSAEFQAAMQQLAAVNPGLAAGLQGLLPGAVAGLTDGLNAVGQGLVDAFRTDTRNMTVGAATLTQPLFMGGKSLPTTRLPNMQNVWLNHSMPQVCKILSCRRTRFTGKSFHSSIRKNWQRIFWSWYRNWIRT